MYIILSNVASIELRGIFRNRSDIHDGAFSGNTQQLKSTNFFSAVKSNTNI